MPPIQAAPSLQAVLFDMDGLLIDSERAIMQAWLQAAASEGVSLHAPAYAAVIGRSSPESTQILTTLLGGDDTYLAVQARAAALLQGQGGGVHFPAKAGALELLAELHERGVPCAVASSSTAEEIHERLTAAGVMPYVQATAGGDEVPFGKPDPAVYLLAASRLGIPASACLAFEDSENGARAALAAGARVIVVPDIRVPADEVTARCHQVLGSLLEAMETVEAWFPRRRRPR